MRGIGAGRAADGREGAAAVARELVDVVPVVMRAIRTNMRRHTPVGSLAQFRALGYLQRHPGASLGALAEHLGVTDATASVLVQRLVRDGLVRRADRPAERRSVAITLTPRGTHLLQRARDATRAKVAAELDTLPARDLAALGDALEILGRTFEEIDHGAA